MRGANKVTPIAHEPPFPGTLVWLEPKDGLSIDAEAWRVAHTYHAETARGHNLSAHGQGILVGLNVVPVGGMEIGVFPGVGIDPLGRFLTVPTPVRLRVEENVVTTGKAYVVIHQTPTLPNEEGRSKEETTVRVVGALPSEPYLELARMTLSSQQSISYPEDPVDPRDGEIDLRFRLTSGGHARGEVTLAELVFPDAGDAHRGVAALIARSVNNDGSYRARYIGKIEPGDALPDGTMLYASGNREFSATTGVKEWLRTFLDSGGTLIGDGCHAAPADPFGQSFDRLARDVNRQLRRIVAGDRLLMSHHLFAAPPPGLAKADAGLVLSGGGVIYLASDFGCVLNGSGDPPPPRAVIRSAEEFATNLAATAVERALVSTFLQ